MFTKPATRLREAVALVRGNPTGVEQLDAEAEAKRKQAEATAKRTAAAQAKVEQDLPAERERLMADLLDRRRLADEMAVDAVARKRLLHKHGLMSDVEIRTSGVPQRVSDDLVARCLKKLLDGPLAAGLDKAGRTPSQVRAEQALAAAPADNVEARIAERKATLKAQAEQRETARRRRNDENKAANEARKRAAGVIRP